MNKERKLVLTLITLLILVISIAVLGTYSEFKHEESLNKQKCDTAKECVKIIMEKF